MNKIIAAVSSFVSLCNGKIRLPQIHRVIGHDLDHLGLIVQVYKIFFSKMINSKQYFCIEKYWTNHLLVHTSRIENILYILHHSFRSNINKIILKYSMNTLNQLTKKTKLMNMYCCLLKFLFSIFHYKKQQQTNTIILNTHITFIIIIVIYW